MSVSGSALQTTLKSPIDAVGIGLHSGRRATLVLRPAAADTGIVFRRTDLGAEPVVFPALWSNAVESPLCSTLTHPSGASVLTIEHLMAALAGLRVDNCLVDLDGPEVPIMDGSAEPFAFLIDCAGIATQSAPRRAVKVKRAIEVGDERAWVRVEPAPIFSLAFEIDFPNQAIGRQVLEFVPDPASFKHEIASARTFGFMEDVTRLHAAGQALGASLDNAVVIEGGRVINPGGLRFGDEFVRHKMLDAIGDLALAGAPLLGRFSFHRSSHALNRRLLAALMPDHSAWGWAPLAAAPAEVPEDWREPALARA